MFKASIWGVLLTLIQILFALSFTIPHGQSLFKDRYTQLVNWDAQRYRDIAINGYRIPSPDITSADIHEGRANVVFFPGYPFAARFVQKFLGVSIDVALLITAQFFCWLFWTYWIRILQLYQIPGKTIAIGTLLILVHPAAFFLIVGYTESIFLSSLLGFILFIELSLTDKKPKKSKSFYGFVAWIHAVMMSLSRIVSFAMIPYPVIRSWKLSFRNVLLGLSATFGAIAFFSYCQYQFQEWSLYFRLEEIGWHNYRRWFAIVDPLSYVPRYFFEHTVESVNRTSVTFTAFLLGMIWIFEQPKKILSIPRERLSIYFCAFVLFYIPLTGKAAANMDSMTRYTFPSFILLVLTICLIELERKNNNQVSIFHDIRRYLIWFGSLIALIVQGWFVYRFVRGKWVA